MKSASPLSRFGFAVRGALIFLLVLAGFVVLPLWSERQEIHRLESQRLHSLTQTLMLTVAQQLKTIQRSLAQLQSDLTTWLQSPDGENQTARRLQALTEAIPGIQSIRVIAQDGTIWASHKTESIGDDELADSLSGRLWIRIPTHPDSTTSADVRVVPADFSPDEAQAATIELMLTGEMFRYVVQAARHTSDMHLALIGASGDPLLILPGSAESGSEQILRSLLNSLPRDRRDEIIVRLTEASPADLHDPRLAAIGAISSQLTGIEGDLHAVVSRDYDDLYARWWRAVEFRSALYLLTALVVLLALFMLRRNLHTQEQLREQAQARQRLFASIFADAQEGILITDAQGKIVELNEAMLTISGYTREELLGQSPRIFKSGLHEPAVYQALWRSLTDDGHWYGELWNRRRDGSLYPALLTISAVRNEQGQLQNYAAIMNDITSLKAQEQALERVAHTDSLTGLPNRRLLTERLNLALSESVHLTQTLAVLFIDLDGFKEVNDRHGHDVGDRLLQTLAQRLREALQEGDTLARLGGDEFIALLACGGSAQDHAAVANRLLRAASLPVTLDAVTVQVSASIGVARYRPEAATATVTGTELLQCADKAMYQAKQAGKNQVAVLEI